MAQTVGSDLRAMAAESETFNTRLVGHHDLNGHGDGMQIWKKGDLCCIAHVGTGPGSSEMALSILDCSNPSEPKLIRQLPHPPRTHRHKVQIVGDVMIQNNERIPEGDPNATPVTGMEIFSLEDPTDPKSIGFYPVPPSGVHRCWFAEMPYAHIAAWLPDVKARAYHIVDMSDPRSPTMAGCWWVPGTKEGDPDPWPYFDDQPGYHRLHEVHGIVPLGDRAYISCTDAGLAILDIGDVGEPKLISHLSWSPPFGGFCHTAMPLPSRDLLIVVHESIRSTREEDGDKRIWVVDIREERQPVTVSSFPPPTPPKGVQWETYHDRPMRFGPHNIHEHRPGGFQDEKRIYSTWFNAGLRIHDVSDPDRPVEIAAFVPPPGPGQRAPQSNDLWVDSNGLIYVSDRVGGGLHIVEYTGG